ncbi:hypothetical protein BLNAU_25207 [Blattamonas nauphoetae]|uniref:Uncharacterized protein n=1 Tax=Blattamonas nauphoetae TaxID=2049346 RepID=A0ABQ9WN06_9EUKA|nr:hypothetical protein BLNAU_25207 [Blattamonas nauphoetae]
MTRFLFRVAELSLSLLPGLRTNHNTFIYQFAALAINTASIVSSDPNELRCLCFGRDSQKWVALLSALDDLSNSPDQCIWINVSWVSLAVLLAASVDNRKQVDK